MAEGKLSYCGQQVRTQDHERFLTCLFAPAETREALFALYAFNLEIAKTAEVVSEPMLGQIRLQWWRESLDGIYARQPRQHAVVEALAEAVTAHGLGRDLFDRLINARERDLDPAPPADLAALEAYAANTSANLIELALDVLGTGQIDAARIAGRHVGAAWALTGLLRAVPFHARQKRLYLPGDLLQKHKVVVGDLFELRPSEGLAAVVAEVAGRAVGHLDTARAQRAAVPSAALPALLTAVLARRHLRVLAQADYNPFADRVQVQATGAAWRLAWAKLRGRY